MDKTIEAIKEIRKKHPGKPEKTIQGTITCPECKGILHFSISDYNGHIWGQCETVNCLMWMM